MKNAIRVFVVVALLIAGFLVLQANKATAGSQAAYDLLDASLDEGGSSMTLDEVHAKLDREPDSVTEPDPHSLIENYEWKSTLRQHTLKVHYSKAATTLMSRIELD